MSDSCVSAAPVADSADSADPSSVGSNRNCWYYSSNLDGVGISRNSSGRSSTCSVVCSTYHPRYRRHQHQHQHRNISNVNVIGPIQVQAHHFSSTIHFKKVQVDSIITEGTSQRTSQRTSQNTSTSTSTPIIDESHANNHHKSPAESLSLESLKNIKKTTRGAAAVASRTNRNDNEFDIDAMNKLLDDESRVGNLTCREIESIVDTIYYQYQDEGRHKNKHGKHGKHGRRRQKFDRKKINDALKVIRRFLDECKCKCRCKYNYNSTYNSDDNKAFMTCSSAVLDIADLILSSGRHLLQNNSNGNGSGSGSTNTFSESHYNDSLPLSMATFEDYNWFTPIALELLQQIETQGYENTIHLNKNHNNNNNNNSNNLRKLYNVVLDILSKRSSISSKKHHRQHHQRQRQHKLQQHEQLQKGSRQRTKSPLFSSSSSSITPISNYIETIKDIIQRMNDAPVEWDISPDTITYNSLLYAYSKSSFQNAAKDCEAVFQHMKEMERQQKQLGGRQNFNNSNVTVDTISYNIVLDSWAGSNDKRGPDRGMALLREMQDRYLNEGNTNVKPNYRSFTILIKAFSMSNEIDAAEKANALLDLMEELYMDNGDENIKPNLFTYNSVLNAWSKSHLPGSSQRCQDLLDQMLDNCCAYSLNDDQVDPDGSNFSSDNRIIAVRPDTVSFAICIKAHANGDEKGSSERALALLKQMMDLSKFYGYNTKPDIGTYNSVLRALANDSEETKATKAECLLRQILENNEDGHLEPDLTTYNNILRCCCTTKSNDLKVRRAAVRIASDTLLRIRQGTRTNNSNRRRYDDHHRLSPDPYTFNFFIKTCDRLAIDEEEKLKLIKAAFQFCIQEGKFSKPVLSILKNSLKPKDLRDILQLGDFQDLKQLKISDFPRRWSDRVNLNRQRK